MIPLFSIKNVFQFRTKKNIIFKHILISDVLTHTCLNYINYNFDMY